MASSLTPVPKVAAAGLGGAVAFIVIAILQRGFHVEIDASLGSAITTVISFACGYITPPGNVAAP